MGEAEGLHTWDVQLDSAHSCEIWMGKEVPLSSAPAVAKPEPFLLSNLHVGHESPEGQFSLQDAGRYISSILRFLLPNPPLFLSVCHWLSTDPAKATACFCHVEGLSLDPTSQIRFPFCP